MDRVKKKRKKPGSPRLGRSDLFQRIRTEYFPAVEENFRQRIRGSGVVSEAGDGGDRGESLERENRSLNKVQVVKKKKKERRIDKNKIKIKTKLNILL